MVENPTKRLHNVNVPNSTVRHQRGTIKKYRIMENKNRLTVLFDPISGVLEYDVTATLPRAELEQLRQEIVDKFVSDYIKILGSLTLRQGDTQNRQQCPFVKQGSASSISAAQHAEERGSNPSTEIGIEVLTLLRQTIEAVKYLVRVQDRSTPIRLRKHDPKLVECLLFQTETLINTLDRYVLPRLTMKEHNRY